ncbi:MAG: hypothetical protein ACOH1V_02300 [Stenotrophomonas sp.]
MADLSPRHRLLQAFALNLQGISIAAGYNTDVGAVVTLEPGQLDPEEVDDGMAVYIERQERATDQAVLRTHRLTTVAVIVKRVAHAAAETTLDAVVDDIERALLNRQPSWPAGFGQPTYQSMEPLRAPAGAGWVGALVRYTTHIPILTR